jgi:hypothetical protein
MKKLCLLMAGTFSLFSLSSQAQSQTVEVGGTTFGIRAGINFQNINGKDDDGDKLENKLALKWHAGVNAEIPIATDFYVQPGLMYITKGAKSEENALGESSKLNLGYLELPVNLLYKPTLGTGKLLLGFGPYLAYGIGGKLHLDDSDEEIDVKFKSKVESGDPVDKYYVKPFDAGANFLVGYEFAQKFSAQLNAQLGLVNINSKRDGLPDDDSRSANTGFGISVGYRF